MSMRNVLKVYGLLRQLTDDETALLETLRSLNEGERELLVETLGPTKKPTAKRTRKASKSPRATSLAGAIGATATGLKAAMTFCAREDCGLNQSSAIHDPAAGYAGYHPFQSAAAQAATGGE